MRLPAGLALILCIAACAAPMESNFSAAQSFRAPEQHSLVLLLHVPAAEPAYREGDPAAKRLVTEALTQRGYRVGLIEHSDYALLLQSELAGLRSRTSSPTSQEVAEAEARALATLAKVACKQADSPLLLRTRLLTRPTTLWQSVASWDGQKRQLPFDGSERVLANVQGTGPGMSLEAVAADPAGRLVVKSYGGASVPYVSGKAAYTRPRVNLFSSDTELKEGIAIALQPVTPR